MLTGYILQRLAQAVLVLVLVSMISFTLIQVTGDPLASYTADASLSTEEIGRLRQTYGLDQPLPVQYLVWLKNIVAGDWGTSYFTRETVSQAVFARLPNTLLLAGIAVTIVLVLGITLGIVSAVRQYSILDYAITGISFVGIAMPSFWLGLLLIIVFAVRARLAGLPYLPVGGMYDVEVGPTAAQVLNHAILPAVTLAAVVCARYVRYVRTAILEQLHQGYANTARAKGIAERTVLVRHVFRNALLPLVTLLGTELPGLLAGSVIVESIFAWPGMGRLFWTSAQHSDLPVLMAITMFVAAVTVFMSLAVDVCYTLIDPRIRYR